MENILKPFNSERYNGSSYTYCAHETLERAKSYVGNAEAWRIRDDNKAIIEEHNGGILDTFDKRMAEAAEMRKTKSIDPELKVV